jgi:hypothetical protein
MTASRGHSQSQSQNRSQGRGQKRTRDMRIGLDDLDALEPFDEGPGPELASQDRWRGPRASVVLATPTIHHSR